jgi:hypothetical protein
MVIARASNDGRGRVAPANGPHLVVAACCLSLAGSVLLCTNNLARMPLTCSQIRDHANLSWTFDDFDSYVHYLVCGIDD